MRPLSQSKKDRIINLLFSGRTYREIADIENVSVGMISKTFKEFIGAAEKSSMEEATAKYNVEERVNRLLDLSREIRELKAKVQTLLSAARLLSFMKARGLNASQMKDYLKMCDKHREDLEDFASRATEFYQLEEKTGKPYDKIVKEYSTLIKKSTDLRTKVDELEKKRKRAKRELNQELTGNSLLRKEIPFASALKATLRKYGFTVEDTSKIPRFLREIEICGATAEVFLQRAQEARDLKWEILDLKDEKKRLEPVVESIRKENRLIQIENEDLKKAKKKLTEEKKKKQNEVRSLKAEALTKSNEIRLAKCIVAILRSKPANFDALYNHLYMWRQISNASDPQWMSRNPHYEEIVRKIIINTFLEHFEDDLAPKEEVTKLQKKLQEAEQQVSNFSEKNIQLTDAKESLSDENTEIKKQLEEVTKELEECGKRLLREPALPPEHPRSPFDV